VRGPLIISGILLLGACSVEPGSQQWCANKKAQPKSEWIRSDAAMHARHCLFDSTTVGSKEWCKDSWEKPKGEWTAKDTASYARYCVM